ncbi:GGDEF domain-containing response regulator [Paucidesulfovibrio longus]|uniref:GGDEF domain-containing response regulator n=1 Tax=Paucidesulfovibrio longus TaxID=889 RepID=UPI00138AFC97|nr:diguanylate cyclase [Paucidesulfovibrio longus]
MNRVLLVDNSKSLLMALSEMIRSRLGMEVVCSLSLADAMHAVKEEGPFLAGIFGTVLVDAEAEEIVRTAAQRVPTVIFTARLDAATQIMLWERGIVDYVAKESMESFEHVVSLLDRLERNPGVGVLVAHNDAAFRRRVAGLLARHNFAVHEAASPDEMLLAVQNVPDLRLILLDARLDGAATTKRLNQVRKIRSKEELAVIVLAKPEDRHSVARLIKFGASGSMSDDFSLEEFYSRVALNLENIETLNRLRESAIRDLLTGAYNRRHLLERGGEEFSQHQRGNQRLSLIMLDADHFKAVNDNYGHETGDEVLRRISDTVRKALRQSDLFARIGGEEFVVLAPGTDGRGAQELAERIREAIEDLRIPLNKGELRVTASLGVAEAASSDRSVEDLLRRADLALYEAKQQGRNRVRSA